MVVVVIVNEGEEKNVRLLEQGGESKRGGERPRQAGRGREELTEAGGIGICTATAMAKETWGHVTGVVTSVSM